MSRDQWLFESRKSPQQVLAGLRSSSLTLAAMVRKPGVRTRERGGGRILLSYSRPFVSNSWRPMFAGIVEPAPEGSRIVGRFRISRFVAAFQALWFGFLLLWIVGTSIAAISGALSGEGDPQLYLMPLVGLGMAAFGIGVTAFGRHGMGERDEREIVSHIERECHAILVSRPPSRPAGSAWRKLAKRPVGLLDRLSVAFQPKVLRHLFTTPRGMLLLAATTVAQLPAFFAFRNAMDTDNSIIGPWVLLMLATALGLLGLVAVAERRTRTVVGFTLVQLVILAPAGFLLLSSY